MHVEDELYYGVEATWGTTLLASLLHGILQPSCKNMVICLL